MSAPLRAALTRAIGYYLTKQVNKQAAVYPADLSILNNEIEGRIWDVTHIPLMTGEELVTIAKEMLNDESEPDLQRILAQELAEFPEILDPIKFKKY